MRKYNELVAYTSKHMSFEAPVDVYDLSKVPSAMDTVAVQQRTFFDEVYTNLSILKSFVEAHGGAAQAEAENILNFLKANLRRAMFSAPTVERGVQDVTESLLVGKGLQKGIDYDRETGRVKHAGKESVPDFIFPKENMALELKLSNREGKLATIVDEINADIVAYATSYERVWFLVYDLGFIRDEAEIVNGLEISENVKCAIVKH